MILVWIVNKLKRIYPVVSQAALLNNTSKPSVYWQISVMVDVIGWTDQISCSKTLCSFPSEIPWYWRKSVRSDSLNNHTMLFVPHFYWQLFVSVYWATYDR